jgi:putative peptide zinc metalloprotease protein
MRHKRSFHDQFYRIADLRVGLRSGTQVIPQTYRGEPWMVLHEPAHNGYFRARPDTYERIRGLHPDKTLGQIWEAQCAQNPASAPGQEAFFDLISELYKANLLYVEGSVNDTSLLERALRKKHKPLPARISEILFFRLPLWDPEPFLQRNRGIIALIYSWPAVLFWAFVCTLALVTFALNSERALSQSSNILQIGNLLPLYLCIFATHILHELSHAALTKYYGGHVRTMGVMLLLFTPLPYADLSSAWGFADKYKRSAVGAAGMYADLFSGSVATLVWAYSPPGFVNEVALNIMFVTAVYTFLFNINPLMRFDGYYILSDLVEIPNLHSAAQGQFRATFRRLAYKEPFAPDQKVSARRRSFLLGFFAVSNVYRLMIMIGIVIFIGDQYFGLGLIVGAALLYTAIFSPVIKAMKPLANPHFTRKNRKPLARMGLVGVLILGVLIFVPMPDHRRLSGVIEAQEAPLVIAPVSGFLEPGIPAQGQMITRGQVIARLDTRELDLQSTALKARLRGAEARAAQANAQGIERLGAISQEIAAMRSSLAEIDKKRAGAVIHARQSGVWVDTGLIGRKGAWLDQGSELGRIVTPKGYVFQAILRQEAAEGLAAVTADQAELCFEGARSVQIPVSAMRLVPYSRRDLPSQALSPIGGGDVAVSSAGADQGKAMERFFLMVAHFEPDPAVGSALQGRSGWLRVTLEPRPLAVQGWRAARQFFQRRYKL